MTIMSVFGTFAVHARVHVGAAAIEYLKQAALANARESLTAPG